MTIAPNSALKLRKRPKKPEDVASGVCGAHLKDGGTCQAKRVEANGRCIAHGGKATGAPQGPRGRLGVWSRFFTEEENEFANQTELGRVDDELAIIRIRLKRLIEAETTQAEQQVLMAKTVTTGDTEKIERKYERTDYRKHIDRCLGRIESLERLRKELAATNPPPVVPPSFTVVFQGSPPMDGVKKT